MSELRDAIQQVRSRIARHRGSRELNEQNTKATLLDPIMRAIGWNLEDLDEVQREYKRKPRDKPVDYAMLVLRSPKLFIEAKALGENLDDRRWANQIMGYAAVAGVEWIVLTNGDEYRVYNAHAPVAVEEKLFRSIRITEEDSPAEETLRLLSKSQMEENRIEVLWKAQFVDRHVRSAIESLFDPEPDSGLVRLLGRHTSNISPKEIRASVSRVRVQLEFPVEDVSHDSPRKKVQPARAGKKDGHRASPSKVSVSLLDLIGVGLISPPLELVKSYKGEELSARIEPDGRVSCLGEKYDSLSIAAGMARGTVVGSPPGQKCPSTNGWTFWKFESVDGKLDEVGTLRQAFLKKKGRSKGK